MVTLTDGNKTVEIIMRNSYYGPDLSNEFFSVGCLPKVDVNGDLAYKVEDVDYCIEQARDWECGRGDYYCDEQEADERFFWYEYLE